MSDSLWVLEYRTRERKNGKWTEWASSDPAGRAATAYREFPAANVFSHDKYERRAIEYVRADSNLAQNLPSNQMKHTEVATTETFYK